MTIGVWEAAGEILPIFVILVLLCVVLWDGWWEKTVLVITSLAAYALTVVLLIR